MIAYAGTLLLCSLVLLVPWNTGGLWARPAEGLEQEQQEPLLETRDSAGAGLLAEMPLPPDDIVKGDQVRNLTMQVRSWGILQIAASEDLNPVPSELRVGIRDGYTTDGTTFFDGTSPSPYLHPYLRRACILCDPLTWLASSLTNVLKAHSTRCDRQESGDASEQAALKAGPIMPVTGLSPLQCLLSINFWLLFFSFCIGAPSLLTPACAASPPAINRIHPFPSPQARTSSLR